MSDAFLIHLAQAIGLGLGASLLLWLFRGYAPMRRVPFPALLSMAMGGLYIIVSGSGVPYEATPPPQQPAALIHRIRGFFGLKQN